MTLFGKNEEADEIVKFMISRVFFFSSRRRHTRLQGDWSSDVCSSDLNYLEMGGSNGFLFRN